jgi:hypothetical protein
MPGLENRVSNSQVTDAEVLEKRAAESPESREDFSRYWGNVISSFETGAQLDLRARLAVEFVKAGMLVHNDANAEQLAALHTPEAAYRIACFAIDTATALVEECTRRGLLKDLPEDDELNRALRVQIRRNARATVYQQVATQQIVNEEMPHVAPAAGALMPGGPMRRS